MQSFLTVLYQTTIALSFAINLASIPDHHLSLSNKAVCLYSWGPHTAFLQTSPLTHTPKTTTAFCTVILIEHIRGQQYKSSRQRKLIEGRDVGGGIYRYLERLFSNSKSFVLSAYLLRASCRVASSSNFNECRLLIWYLILLVDITCNECLYIILENVIK